MKRIKIKNLLEDKNTLNCFCNDMQNGALAVIPTDTLYGFAVSFNSKEAVEKVYRIKNRDSRKPLILFVTNVEELAKLGLETTEEYKRIIQSNWPGGLTAILKKPSTGELAGFAFPTIGIRAPNHNNLLKLLDILPVKLLTTSANRSGAPSDTNPDVIADEFSSEIDWLIDDGVLPCGIPSTVVDFSVKPFKILRQGKVRIE